MARTHGVEVHVKTAEQEEEEKSGVDNQGRRWPWFLMGASSGTHVRVGYHLSGESVVSRITVSMLDKEDLLRFAGVVGNDAHDAWQHFGNNTGPDGPRRYGPEKAFEVHVFCSPDGQLGASHLLRDLTSHEVWEAERAGEAGLKKYRDENAVTSWADPDGIVFLEGGARQAPWLRKCLAFVLEWFGPMATAAQELGGSLDLGPDDDNDVNPWTLVQMVWDA